MNDETYFLNPDCAGAHLFCDIEANAVADVIRAGFLFRYGRPINLSVCDKVERRLSQFFHRQVDLVGSGTAGLKAALTAGGVAQGDRVLVSGFTFIASASAVVSCGAVPVPLEVDSCLGVDLSDLAAKLPGAKAVIAVYAPGHPSNIDEVSSLVKSEGAVLIEDACQAFGVRSNGRLAGTIGDYGVFSFQQGKQISSGEGGAVLSRDRLHSQLIKSYVDHGAIRNKANLPNWDDTQTLFGENLRLTELQGAILQVQFEKFSGMIDRQEHIRNMMLDMVGDWEYLVPAHDRDGHTGTHFLMMAPSEELAAKAIAVAQKNRIKIRWVWKKTFNRIPMYLAQDFERGQGIPRTEWMSKRVITVPTPPMNKDEVQIMSGPLNHTFMQIKKLWA